MVEAPANPYVGPRSFEERDSRFFFGRDRESRQLASLIIAQRIVVFYAPSGAGKTSLLQASVIPDLRGRKGLRVLPVARPGGDLPPGIRPDQVANIYTLNVLLHLRDPDAPLENLVELSLEGGMAQVLSADEDVPALLIIDQFEELFTTHAGRHPERAAFVRELQETLEAHPRLSLLISMREDFIANLDAYAPLLPDRLRTRYRMEPLSASSALEAVREPAGQEGRPFEPGVAEALVDDLRRLQVGRRADAPSAREEIALGPYVEPVHLQIVCRQLWAHLPQDQGSIRVDDLRAFGNVDEALVEFYEAAVRDVLTQTGVSQRGLRTWVDGQLITPARTRGLVYRGEAETAGLPNDAIDILNNAYIVRAYMRGGDLWYELAHDRMVDPVLQANQAWYAQHQSPWHSQAALWEGRGRAEGLVLRGQELAEAEAWAEGHPEELTEQEADFLAASQEVRRQEQQAGRRQRQILIGGAIAIIIMALLSVWALRNADVAAQNLATAQAASTEALRQQAIAEAASTEALRQQAIAEAASTQALDQKATAEAASSEASRQQIIAEGAFGIAESQKATAQANESIARSRQLAAQSASFLDDQPDLAALLAVEAYRHTDTLEARTVLQENLQRALGQSFEEVGPPFPVLTGDILSVAFSPDGERLAWGSADGSVVIWNSQRNEPEFILTEHSQAVRAVAFSPDGKILASGSQDYRILLWDIATGESIQLNNPNVVLSLSFSPDGRYLAAAVGTGVSIWDMDSQTRIRSLTGPHDFWVYSVAWSPNGERIASAAADSLIVIWNPDNGKPILTFDQHRDLVYTVAWSPDGSLLASGDRTGALYLWQIATGKPLAGPIFPNDREAVYSTAFSPNGELLATGGEDATIGVFDVQTLEEVARLKDLYALGVWSLAFDSQNGQAFLLSGSLDNTVHLHVVNPRQPLSEPVANIIGQQLVSLGIEPDGGQVMLGLERSRATVWRLGEGGVQASPEDFPNVTTAALSPEGALVALGDESGLIQVVDLTTGEAIELFGPLDGEVTSLAWSPDLRKLASGHCRQFIVTRAEVRICTEDVLVVWDLATGDSEELSAGLADDELGGHADAISALSFDPQGTTLASGGRDGLIIFWDLFSLAPIGLPLSAHTGSVLSLAYAPDGTALASAGIDGTLAFWDSATNVRIGTPLESPSGGLASLDFDESGIILYAGSLTGELSVWDLDLRSWVERLCGFAQRQLTQSEWTLYFPGEAYAPSCP